LDCETAEPGLIDESLPLGDPGQPMIAELAAILDDEHGDTISTFHVVVRPDDWVIGRISKTHGITDETAKRFGIPLSAAFAMLGEFAAVSEEACAYNASFDFRVIASACHRLGLENPIRALRPVCVMEEFSNYHGTGRMKLALAYETATARKMTASHTAMSDCRAARAVHQWILNRQRQKEKVNAVLTDK
jgi:DNA polymerase III epsilon subunit-like protein